MLAQALDGNLTEPTKRVLDRVIEFLPSLIAAIALPGPSSLKQSSVRGRRLSPSETPRQLCLLDHSAVFCGGGD